MEIPRVGSDNDSLMLVDSDAEERSGAIGKVATVGDVATYLDLKYEDRELNRSYRAEELARESKAAKLKRIHDKIVANATGIGESGGSYYFVRNPGVHHNG